MSYKLELSMKSGEMNASCYVYDAATNALVNNTVFDSNTVVVEVVTLVSMAATIGQSRTVTISVDYGMDGQIDLTSPMSFTVGQTIPFLYVVKV